MGSSPGRCAKLTNCNVTWQYSDPLTTAECRLIFFYRIYTDPFLKELQYIHSKVTSGCLITCHLTQVLGLLCTRVRGYSILEFAAVPYGHSPLSVLWQCDRVANSSVQLYELCHFGYYTDTGQFVVYLVFTPQRHNRACRHYYVFHNNTNISFFYPYCTRYTSL